MLEQFVITLVKKDFNFQFDQMNKSITLLNHDGLDFEKSLTITPKYDRAIIELTPIIYQSRIASFPSVNTFDAFAKVVNKIKSEYGQIKIEALELDLNSYYDDSKLYQYFTISLDIELSETTDIDAFVSNLLKIQVEFQKLTDLIVKNVSKVILAMAVNHQLAKAA